MSKDFEKAYRELAKSEAPDLWDRIESGISQRSTQGQAREEKEKEKETAHKKQKKRSGKILYGIYRYSPMAAAVICAIIIIPIFINGDKPAPSLKAEMEEIAESEAGDLAAGPQEEGIAQADAGAVQDSVVAESAEEESGAQKSAVTESAADDSAEQERAVQDRALAGGAVQESAMEESGAQKSAVAESTADDCAQSKKTKSALSDTPRDPEAISRVVVEVTESRDVSAQENAQEAGTAYTALVERDPEGILAAGEEIAIFIPVSSSVSLAVGEVFELDLAYWEEDEEFFTVCGFYGQAEK